MLQAAEECDEAVTGAIGGADLSWQLPPPPFALSPSLLMKDTIALRDFVSSTKGELVHAI